MQTVKLHFDRYTNLQTRPILEKERPIALLCWKWGFCEKALESKQLVDASNNVAVNVMLCPLKAPTAQSKWWQLSRTFCKQHLVLSGVPCESRINTKQAPLKQTTIHVTFCEEGPTPPIVMCTGAQESRLKSFTANVLSYCTNKGHHYVWSLEHVWTHSLQNN